MKNKKINKKINKNFLAIAFLVVIFGVFTFGYSAQAIEIDPKNIVDLTNQTRIENGLDELFVNPVLNRIASKKAQHMINYHYFSHNSPEGTDPWHWFKEERYDYKYAGENLAINYRTAEEQHIAWMKSTTHKKNILNQKYKEIGIATASGYINNKPATITVQIFGTPQKSAATIATITPDNKIIQKTQMTSYVLGKQIDYPVQTQYLNKSYPALSNTEKTHFLANNDFLSILKEQSHNLSWAIILILCLIIIRGIVLKSIASPTIHRPAITNLILLIMLWLVFIEL